MDIDDCWLYAGYKNELGYGLIFHNRKYQYAHRVSYETFVGKIPDSYVIDHLCRVRHCINPEHLEPVTARVNTLRGEGVLVNKRKTHCPKGHEYTIENTQYFGSKGWRRCRECALSRHKANYLKRKNTLNSNFLPPPHH